MKLERRQKAEAHGRRSETLAALYLACKLYRVIGRRVKTRAGELDLIAVSPSGVLCFVEVKARGLETTQSKR
jgi:putative endonuclease